MEKFQSTVNLTLVVFNTPENVVADEEQVDPILFLPFANIVVKLRDGTDRRTEGCSLLHNQATHLWMSSIPSSEEGRASIIV